MEFFTSLHHKIIHFPIAFLIVYPFIEVITLFYKNEKLDYTSMIILILGVVASLFAVLTGNQILNSMKDMSPDLYALTEAHYTNANITVLLFTFILFGRIFLQNKKKYSGKWKIILIIISFIGCYFVYRTGELGGRTTETRLKESGRVFMNGKMNYYSVSY